MEEVKNRRSAFREISKKEMDEVLEKAALKHKEGVYRLPQLYLREDDKGIAIFSKMYSGVINIPWDALISIRYKPAEGDASGMLTFHMIYGVATIVVEDNSYDGRDV